MKKHKKDDKVEKVEKVEKAHLYNLKKLIKFLFNFYHLPFIQAESMTQEKYTVTACGNKHHSLLCIKQSYALIHGNVNTNSHTHIVYGDKYNNNNFQLWLSYIS